MNNIEWIFFDVGSTLMNEENLDRSDINLDEQWQPLQ